MSEEYDPKTCWTAGELRQMGVVIEGEVPDVAWIPVEAMTFEMASAKPAPPGEDPSRITVSVSIRLTQPFRWVSINVDVAASPTP